MFEMWQDWIILFSVLGAAAYLVYRFIRWRNRRSICGDCKLRKMALGEGAEAVKNRSND